MESMVLGSQQMSADEYHSLPGVSNSRLCDALEDLRLYWWKHLSGQYEAPNKQHFDFGSAVHELLLLGSRANIVAIPDSVLTKDGKRYGRAWDAFLSENAGKLLLKEAEYAAVERCVAAVMCHPVAAALLAMDGQAEHVFQYTDDDLGLTLRCRPDKLCVRNDGRKVVLDLKTTGTGSHPKKFVKSVANFRYHCQEYFYRKVLARCGIEVDEFVFVAVSTEAPHTVDCYTLSDEFRALAEQEVEEGLWRLAEQTRKGDWEELMRSKDLINLQPPNYLRYSGDYAL